MAGGLAGQGEEFQLPFADACYFRDPQGGHGEGTSLSKALENDLDTLANGKMPAPPGDRIVVHAIMLLQVSTSFPSCSSVYQCKLPTF